MGLFFVTFYSVYSSRAHYSYELRRRELEELDRKVKYIQSTLSSSTQWYEATEKKIMNSKVSDGGTLQEEIQALLSSSSFSHSNRDPVLLKIEEMNKNAESNTNTSASSINNHIKDTIKHSTIPSTSTTSTSTTTSNTNHVSTSIPAQSIGINGHEKAKKPPSYNIKL